jgi:outer membrane lipopolysaccharide assembly protein LptE/RlpB
LLYKTRKKDNGTKCPPGLMTACIFCLFMAVASCGYKFSGGASLPGDARSLAVKTFINKTGEIGIEAVITNDILYELTRTAGAAFADEDNADAVLTGTIRSARRSNISHRTAHSTAERRITVVVDVQLSSPDGKTLWALNGISASEEYAVASDNMVTEQNKKSAVSRLSKRLAQRIYYQMTDDF